MEFRPLTDADLPMLHGWLNERGVVRWWEGDDVSWAGVLRDYGPGRDPSCAHFIAVEEGRDLGWIQCCDLREATGEDGVEAQAWWDAGVPKTAAGIDYLVGDPAARGKGLGTRMIDAFVTDVVFPNHPWATHAGASPMVANEASWKALASAGFHHVADVPDAHGQARIMLRPRDTNLAAELRAG